MSDNVSMELCEQIINASLRMPATEVWAEIFSFLPRRILVQRIQPVGKYFKNVCNKHVNTVHMITNAGKFLEKLNEGDAEANKQLETLSANSCQLADQFRIDKFIFYVKNAYKFLEKLSDDDAEANKQLEALSANSCQFRIDKFIFYTNDAKKEAISAAFFCHSKDLFQAIQMDIKDADQLDHLTMLESAKPVQIKLVSDKMRFPHEIILRHPTVLGCLRLELQNCYIFGMMCRWNMAMCQWLHHKPIGSAADHNREVVDSKCGGVEPKPRCLTITNDHHKGNVEWLLEHCFNYFRLSRSPMYRRHFVLRFKCSSDVLKKFAGRLENPATGEMLILERVQGEDDEPTGSYRLLRCMASQVANGTEQFYEKLFKPDGEFNVEDGKGKKSPSYNMVMIET